MELAELSSFDALIREHKLPKRWKYQQLNKLSVCFKRFRLPVGDSAGYMVPVEEMKALILMSSRKGGILPLLYSGWNVLSGRRMTFLSTQSHGKWQRHYAIPRDKGKVAVSELAEFIELKPRFLFFMDFIKDFEEVFSKSCFGKLLDFLQKAQKTAREYISKRCRDPRVAKLVSMKSYEDFYLYFMDKLVFGEAPETAFGYAMTRAPKISEISDGQGSSKEVGFQNMELLEETAIDGARQIHSDSTFHLDFKKYARGFFLALLNEYRTNMPKGWTVRDARRAAGTDYAIFIMRLRGLTDEEIHEKLAPHLYPKRSRQYVGEMRKAIMLKAQQVFAPLREE